MSQTLPILYQDQHIVVVNKTSGLLVHRSPIDRYAREFAMQIVRDQLGEHVYPVHRLDRATSGALMFARSAEVARQLGVEFASQQVDKTYLAVVRGTSPAELTIDYALKEELDDKSDRLARQDKPAQPALTYISTVGTYEFQQQVDKYPTSRYSLVKARPLTGRKHQIRRHLRHIGHPIIGDVTHGSGKHNRFFESTFKTRRLLLACIEMGFTHPLTKSWTVVRAPLAPEFAAIVRAMGWSENLEL